MERQQSRVSRRAALRAGAVVGAAGAGLAAGATGTRLGPGSAAAQPASWRMVHLEVDSVVEPAVSIVRAGSGPPQRGDSFYLSARLYPAGQTNRPQIGVYQCFGAWTAAGTETDAPDQRLTTVQYHLAGRGAIMGLINEGGANPSAHIGAVQGGTGEFTGALGTFRQVLLSGPLPGVAAGQAVARGVLDLMLPAAGPTALPRTGDGSGEDEAETE